MVTEGGATVADESPDIEDIDIEDIDIEDIDIEDDRRRAPVRTLHQPVEPARIRAVIGGRVLLEQADVVELNDRTMVLEVRDAALALALSIAPEVVVSVDLGGATTTLVTEPGRRADDNPTSRRVELILRQRR